MTGRLLQEYREIFTTVNADFGVFRESPDVLAAEKVNEMEIERKGAPEKRNIFQKDLKATGKEMEREREKKKSQPERGREGRKGQGEKVVKYFPEIGLKWNSKGGIVASV